MTKEVLSKFPYELMPTIVMLLFVLFFVSMVVWVYRKGSSELYGSIEQLPLKDEDGPYERR